MVKFCCFPFYFSSDIIVQISVCMWVSVSVLTTATTTPAGSFELHNRWWIEKLFWLWFVVGGGCSCHLLGHCLIILYDNLVVIHRVSMECTLTHTKLFKYTYTKTVQAVNHHMGNNHTKYTAQTNDNRLARLPPIQQSINWFLLRSNGNKKHKKNNSKSQENGFVCQWNTFT